MKHAEYITVGIVAGYKKESVDHMNRVAFWYVEAIENAGGIPYIIPCNSKNIEPYLEKIDAFIFPGGIDIDPAIYGEELAGAVGIARKNDEYLLNFMEKATQRKKPILGICKGMQLINVFCGGKLVQHLPNADFHNQEECQYTPVDYAILEENGFLHRIFETREIPINSIHHQAISILGNQLQVAAISKHDGTIEAVEHAILPLYGVQWHPECLGHHQKIFEWFVDTFRQKNI